MIVVEWLCALIGIAVGALSCAIPFMTMKKDGPALASILLFFPLGVLISVYFDPALYVFAGIGAVIVAFFSVVGLRNLIASRRPA